MHASRRDIILVMVLMTIVIAAALLFNGPIIGSSVVE